MYLWVENKDGIQDADDVFNQIFTEDPISRDNEDESFAGIKSDCQPDFKKQFTSAEDYHTSF